MPSSPPKVDFLETPNNVLTIKLMRIVKSTFACRQVLSSRAAATHHGGVKKATTSKTIFLSLILFGSLSGCAGLVAGGAAAGIVTGAAVAHDRRTAGTVVEDQAIELKAYDALNQDRELAERGHINVTSYNNIVLLSGEVPTPELRKRAGEIVSRIEKVRHVHNELADAPPSSLASRSTDTWITTKVKTSLLQVDGIRDFDPTRVKVVTERGIVYLLGLLHPREADAVTRTVRRVNGVQKVVKLFEYIDQGQV